jgi:hypothetical protein
MWKYVSVCDGSKLCLAAASVVVVTLIVNEHIQQRFSTSVPRRVRRCAAGIRGKVEKSEKMRNKNVVKVNFRSAVYFS